MTTLMTGTPSPTHPVDALVLARVAPAVRERAAGVRLMVFDVDGVMTDGSLYYGEHGETLKRFHVLDGHGLRLLREGGLAVAFVTGRSGPILARRAAELGISDVMQGVRDKGAALQELAQRLGVSLSETGFMGDDIIDLSALQRAGFAASVPNAPAYVAQSAHWISTLPGGNGAVRECCDLLLAARGRLGGFLSSPGLLGPGAIQ
jgi:3-deoxy-D-manno-octulosonate 8-phosphate phosphatase (KDO 8-P phosphatase)